MLISENTTNKGRIDTDCKLILHKEQSMESQVISLYQWIDDWYSIYKLPKLKKSSISTMRSVIKNHIKGNIPNVPLKELNVLQIDKALSTIKSTKQRRVAYIIIGDCLRKAYKIGLIERNIAELIEPVIHRPKQGQALDNEIIQIILNACTRPKVQKLFLFYLYTGCRKKEALLIKWADIDYKKNIMHIPGTKRESSNRYIPLFDNVKELLQEIDTEHKDNEYVWQVSESVITREIKAIKDKLNIQFSVKDFRTTFATTCHKLKIDDLVIQRWMGHSDVQTTQQYYIKFDNTLNEQAIQLYNQLKYDHKNSDTKKE